MQNVAEHWTTGQGTKARTLLGAASGSPFGRGSRVSALARVRRPEEGTEHQDRRGKQGQGRLLRFLTSPPEPTDPAPGRHTETEIEHRREGTRRSHRISSISLEMGSHHFAPFSSLKRSHTGGPPWRGGDSPGMCDQDLEMPGNHCGDCPAHGHRRGLGT